MHLSTALNNVYIYNITFWYYVNTIFLENMCQAGKSQNFDNSGHNSKLMTVRLKDAERPFSFCLHGIIVHIETKEAEN